MKVTCHQEDISAFGSQDSFQLVGFFHNFYLQRFGDRAMGPPEAWSNLHLLQQHGHHGHVNYFGFFILRLQP